VCFSIALADAMFAAILKAAGLTVSKLFTAGNGRRD
jgi:hypothetical protein